MDFTKLIKDLTGKDVIYRDEDMVETWKEWYAGNVAKFHTYDDYNGLQNVTRKRKTLNMAKRSCEDWANLLLNEKTDIAIGDEKNQQQMTELLNKLKFWTKGNQSIEIAFALSLGAWIEGVDDKKQSKFQFVDRTKIYPLTVEDDEITECAFANLNAKKFVLQIFEKNADDNYVIRTVKGDIKDKNYEVTSDDGETPFETKTNIPWFQFIKPNIVNNIDISSPMGVSVYANAIDALKGIDVAYTDFVREMELGKARVNVNKAVTFGTQGETPTFDNNNELFYFTGSESEKPLEMIAPPLRLGEFTGAINNALNIYSTLVGFGANHYRYDQNGVTTATQVISENSDMFRTLKKHEILLQDAMVGALRALMYIENTFGTGKYKFNETANIEIKFDDSIIEDKEQQKINDRQDVNMGVMSKVEFRMKHYAEDKETAEKKIAEIAENSPSVANYFSGLEE